MAEKQASAKNKRIFQKELKYNKILPYYDKLSEEADRQLAAIKTGLGHSILMREVTPGFFHWSFELSNYIALNSLRFSKEDHVLFIKIFYQLISTPDLELRPLDLFCQTLSDLLDNPDLLTRNDLELNWRPLYALYDLVVYKNLSEHRLLIVPKGMQKTLESLISKCRIYFSISSTREILNEFRPMMCPGDSAFDQAMACMALFLPTDLPPDQDKSGYLLWLDEMLYWWKNSSNRTFELNLIELLSRLPYEAIFNINLDVNIPIMFTKILRSFEISLSGRSSERIDPESWTTLIVSAMGGDNKVQDYISQLCQVLESYVHPSNVGPWQYNILNFLYYLASGVCDRVHLERYHRVSWRHRIPDKMKLTDKQIDTFVSSVLPCALSGMFDTGQSEIAVKCLRCLSHLSSKLIISEVLERMFSSLDLLIEPHRLTQSLSSVIAVILPFVRDSGSFSSRNQIIPFMIGILPALDRNDVEKCSLTLQALTYFFKLVSVVNCEQASTLRKDLTSEESDLCSETAVFESFANQFLDKMFSMVESFGHAFDGCTTAELNDEEESLLLVIYQASTSLLGNCSSKIYNVVVDRLYKFVADNLFERQTAAEFLGQLCAAAVSTNPRKTFARFLTQILIKLKDEMKVDDKVNCSNIIWYLTLFFHLTKCDGDVIVEERKTLIGIFQLILPIKSKVVWNLLSETVSNILYRLTSLYILERCDTDRSVLDRPLVEYMPIRHWAKTCKLNETNFQWHMLSDMEFEFTKQILNLFLFDQIKLVDKPQDMTRDEIWKSITFINHCIVGSAALLPLLDGPQVKTVDSCIDFSNFTCVASNHDRMLDVDCRNIRVFVAEKMRVLMEFIIKSRNSEPKCLSHMCSLFYNILFSRSIHRDDVSTRSDTANQSILAFTDKVVGKKSYTKTIHFAKTMLQHETRLLQTNGYKFTEVHRQICLDLLKLSTSHYVEVRVAAQQVFDCAINHFWYSHRLFIDSILSFLKADPSTTDDQLKGALYVLLGTSKESMFICRDWKYWHKVWPAIILAEHSKKPSVIALLEYIRSEIIDNVISFCVKFEFPIKTLELAKQLWTIPEENSLSSPLPDEVVITKAKVNERTVNEENITKYYALVDDLVNLTKNTNLHWRHMDMAYAFLIQIIRMDYRLTAEAVKIFVRLLVNDTLDARNRGFLGLSTILKMHRHKTTKLKIDVRELLKKTSNEFQISFSSDPWPAKCGFRKDNETMCYDQNMLPMNEQLWNDYVFIDKTYKGFYCWPTVIKISAPPKQPLIRTKNNFTPEEIPVYDAFTNEEYVKKFCRLMCIEEDSEVTESDDLSSTEILLFKGLFRTYGDSVLIHFKNVIESIVSTKSTKSQQKFAATFFVGLLSGAKYWSFEKNKELWIWLNIVMRQALNIIPAETDGYWYDCVSTIFADRDPRKLFWLVEILLELAQKPMETPFNASNRISFLQACIAQQQWRTTEIGKKILPVLKQWLAQPYQNVRTELGRILSSIFCDNFPNVTLESNYLPANLDQFMNEVWGQLSILRKEVETVKPDHIKHIKDSQERKQAILLFKTLMSFFRYKRNSSVEAAPFASLRFMPLFCYFANEISDEELRSDCITELYSGIARCLLMSDKINDVLEVCKKCSQITWWKSRVMVLQMLQVSILSNLFLYSTAKHCSFVKDLVLSLLKDERIEVRDAAMNTLSGLLHCRYFPTEKSLLEIFRSWSKSKSIVERHAGVLGLSAVVKSCPYTVPCYLPDVIVDLCGFKAEKQPIKGTVEKTLNEFKRTHQDSWREHKDRFTDDQLFVMTEVLISPTYYV